MRESLKQVGTIVAVFLPASLLLAVLATAFPLSAWSYLAFVLYVLFCLALARFSAITFVLLSPLLALRMTEMLSGISIENGAYMFETAVHGHATGAFSRLLVFYVLFFSLASVCCELFCRSLIARLRAEGVREDGLQIVWYCLVVVFACSSLYLLYIGVRSGFPAFTGVDRFKFLNDQSMVYRWILHNRIVFAPLLGYFAVVQRYRLVSILALVWIVGLSLLFSEKFTSLLLLVTLFCAPVGAELVARLGRIPLRAIVSIGGAVTVVTVPMVLYVYGALENPERAVQRYGERVALQGQLWFLADQPDRYFPPVDWTALSADAATWYVPNRQDFNKVGMKFGLYYVMSRYATGELLEASMEYGGGFVFSLYPYLMMTTGIVGLVLLSSLIAVIHSFAASLLVRSLFDHQWLAALCFAKAISNILSAYITGYLWFVFGHKNLAFIALGLAMMVLPRLLVRRRIGLR